MTVAHSITSSARASSVGGISRPSAFRLQVDDKLEFGGLHHRQLSGLGTFENPPGKDSGLAIGVGEADAVTQETAGLRKVRKRVDAGNGVARGQGRELVASRDEETVSTHHEGINVQLTEERKSRIDVARIARFRSMCLHPNGTSRRFHLRHFGLGPWEGRIDNHGDRTRVRQQVADQFKPLRCHLGCQQAYAG
jgi:hypothetical protein